MKFLGQHYKTILLLTICLSLLGYWLYEKGQADMREKVYNEQMRIEKEKQRAIQIEKLKEYIPRIQARLQIEFNKLNEINEFHFLRTAKEKEDQLVSQNKIINDLKRELNRSESELLNLESTSY